MKNRFFYSDMADECAESVTGRGYDTAVKILAGGVKVTTLLIKRDEDAKALNRAKGKYVTLDLAGAVQNYKTRKDTTRYIRDIIRDMTSDIVRNNPKVLVAGLGNRYIAADALGIKTCENLIVGGSRRTEVSAISTGVFGMTGLESADAVRGVAKEINAGVVIAVDTLATSRIKRVFSSFQVTDAGVEPGSATNAERVTLNYKNVGVPVLAVGVPTCIYAKSLVYESIAKTDKTDMVKTATRYNLTQDILGVENLGLLLTPKDVEGAVKYCAEIISDGINLCFSGETKQ